MVKYEFFKLTSIIPLRPANRLEDKNERKDTLFAGLALKVFDQPGLLPLLNRKIKDWLKEPCEFTYALAGYLSYLGEDYGNAEKFFARAVRENPANVDNWFDLAFSLYHQGPKKHGLAKKILFRFDDCVRRFEKERFSLPALKRFLCFTKP